MSFVLFWQSTQTSVILLHITCSWDWSILDLATRVCVVPLGVMAQREGTPVSIVHFTPFGRMILQISSCRD